MKRILIVLLILTFAQASLAVIVDGYCYLEGESNHLGTKVKFIKDSPSAITDSTYTNASGYFNIDLVPGIYDVEYSHADYFTMTRNEEVLTTNTTLPPIYLELSMGLSGPLSGIFGPGYYRVAGDISVALGDSLRIMPGTTFRFDGQFEFTINGILLAEGTVEDSIFFTTDITFGPEWWGGLRFYGEESSGSSLSYCLIRKGRGSPGGGVYCENSSPSFTNCAINDNYSNSNGGGVYCENSSPTLTNCNISDNTAAVGGGVRCVGSSPNLINCTISGNTAAVGGGVDCIGGSANFTNCNISDNSASYGGGVTCWESSSPTFTNCTLKGNEAGDWGGGV
ncbi:hypothetical protein KKG05_00130, partial [bacterium]|nr:hypothetical protein [bacterium]